MDELFTLGNVPNRNGTSELTLRDATCLAGPPTKTSSSSSSAKTGTFDPTFWTRCPTDEKDASARCPHRAAGG